MSGTKQHPAGVAAGYSAVFKAAAPDAGNPYHGPNGWFTTKEKAKVISRPGKQKKFKSIGLRRLFGLRD